MGEKIIEFPGPKNKYTEKVTPKKYKHEQEPLVSLDMDKYMWLMGILSAFKKSDPDSFKKLRVQDRMEAVGEYSDHELIMKINNCTENSINADPCLYLAMNYEAWNRNLIKDDENKESINIKAIKNVK